MPRREDYLMELWRNPEGGLEGHWNYRLVQHDDCVGLHEVFYNGGRVMMWSEKPIIVGDTVQEVLDVLEMMRRDTEKYRHDILPSHDMPHFTQVPDQEGEP
jgi:hypothetical protein